MKAYIYLFTRAIVRRYKHVTHYWQLENELNAAAYSVLTNDRAGYHAEVSEGSGPSPTADQPRGGATSSTSRQCILHASKRSRASLQPALIMDFVEQHGPRVDWDWVPLLGQWWVLIDGILKSYTFIERCVCHRANMTFVSRHLELMYEATRVEDPDAVIVVNVLTDLTDPLAKILQVPTWSQALTQWASFYDVIGIDSYPNRFGSYPILTPLFKDIIATAVHLMNGSVPVWVTETGYPVWEQLPMNVPATVNFTQERQAEYYKTMLPAAFDAGAEGFYAYGAW